jgi:hypothetical protein
VEAVANNNKGVWVAGNARSAGSFSASVKLLTGVANVAGACVYASNYPPAANYTSPVNVSFRGTPKYDLTLRHTSGSSMSIQSGGTYLVPSSYTLVSFTDATGAPGIINCKPPVNQTLQVSASDFCAGSKGVTFVLQGTETGCKYELYRDNTATGTVLTGAGSAATFTGTFNVAGSYSVRSVTGLEFCQAEVSGTQTVTQNPLPANPAVTAGVRCGAGTVTVSATSSGAEIDWYTAATGGTSVSTGASYTPSVSTSTTYYAQARIVATGCISAARTAVLATVNTLPVISTHPQSQMLCGYSATLTLTVTATAGSGSITTYQWKQDGVNVGTNSSTYTAVVSKNDKYSVTVINSNGCITTSNTAEVKVSGAEAGRIVVGATPTCTADPGKIATGTAPSCTADPGRIEP